MRIDARIPVVFGPVAARADDHVLTEGADFELPADAGGTHVAGCSCCAGGRNPVAGLLGGLFFARGRGTVPFFRRVVVAVVTSGAREAVERALAEDPVVSGCFRGGQA